MARCDHVKTSCDFRLCQEVVFVMNKHMYMYIISIRKKESVINYY